MKTKKRAKKLNKPILIIAASVLLVGLAAFSAYAFILEPQTDKPADTTQIENTPSTEQPSDTPETPSGDKETTTNTDVPPAPTTSGESDKKQVQMVASVDQSNGTVYIRGGANYPVDGGSCYAQLKGPSGQSVRKDADVLSNPASTDCKTISIPVSELAPGKWTVTLNYTSDEYEGASIEIAFTV